MKTLDISELKNNIWKILEPECFKRYLDGIVANPGWSYLNHLFLFTQTDKAEKVCGRGAWHAMNREIKPDAKQLYIIYPAIVVTDKGVPYTEDEDVVSDIETGIKFMIKQTQFDIRYLVMGVYAESDTSGKQVEDKTQSINFMDRIAIITQSTPEVADIDYGIGQMGKYDPEVDMFYISPKCPAEKKNSVWISSYIKYVMHDNRNDDKELALAVRYVCLKYFNCDVSDINPKLFGLLKKRSQDELIVFLRELQKYSWKVINELSDVPILSFDETAYINTLMNSDDADEIYCLFDRVISSIDYVDPQGLNDDIKEELVSLRKKISLLDEDNIIEMYIKKQKNMVYTYPACDIRYDLTNYLKK